MFRTKNLSIAYLSFLSALLISAVVAIAIGLLFENWLIAALSFIVLLLTIFFFIKFIFNWFVYRKIKIIYKLIYNTKASKRAEAYYKYILPQKSIEEVSNDVEIWAAQHGNELEQMQKNEAYRREFLQNLSHEFKTPIFAIQGYIETVLPELEEGSIGKKFLTNAHKNVERMVLLVKDLDEISKLETGEQPLHKERFVVQDLIREVYEELEIKIDELNIKTQIKKGCELPIAVFADKEKIRRVLMNLVVNASKYGKQNGTINAGIYKTDENNVLVEITDDGIGIAEEHLQRIFERFYRTDKGRSRNVGGSGLGLAICKHIIEAHGKSMHVRSTPDVGTTIGFTLETK